VHADDGVDDARVVEGIVLDLGRKVEHYFPCSTRDAAHEDALAAVVRSNEAVHSNDEAAVVHSSSEENASFAAGNL